MSLFLTPGSAEVFLLCALASSGSFRRERSFPPRALFFVPPLIK